MPEVPWNCPYIPHALLHARTAPPHSMILAYDALRDDRKLAPEVALWCEETLKPGWQVCQRTCPIYFVEENGYNGVFSVHVRKQHLRCDTIRFADDTDMVAFRLCWPELTVTR